MRSGSATRGQKAPRNARARRVHDFWLCKSEQKEAGRRQNNAGLNLVSLFFYPSSSAICIHTSSLFTFSVTGTFDRTKPNEPFPRRRRGAAAATREVTTSAQQPMMAGWGTRRFAHRPASERHHHSRVLVNHHARVPRCALSTSQPTAPRGAASQFSRDVRGTSEKLAAGGRAIARAGGVGQRRSRARRAFPCRRGRGRPVAGFCDYTSNLSAAPASWQPAYGARWGTDSTTNPAHYRQAAGARALCLSGDSSLAIDGTSTRLGARAGRGHHW